MSENQLNMIGLIGGMSWQSTQTYYGLINEGVQVRFGGNSSAPLWLYSVNFAEIERLQAQGAWDEAGEKMAEAAVKLEAAGAQALVLCTNTMHKLSDFITEKTSIPLLHIVDATAEAILTAKARSCVLLATRYTMEQDFYKSPLADKLTDRCTVHIPDASARTVIHDIIYKELCQGVITDASRARYLDIIQEAAEKWGCDSVILGCTEIGLLIKQHHTSLHVFDTTALHCEKAVEFICSGTGFA